MHKGIKYITSLLCGVSLITAGTAGAQTMLEYDMSSGRLDVYGTISDAKAVYATFSVLPSEVDPESLTESSPELGSAIYKTVALSTDGGFDESIVIPSGFAPGEYVLRSYGTAFDGMGYFTVVSEDVTKGDLSAVNSAKSPSEATEAIKALSKIPFDKATLAQYGKRIGEYIYSNKPSSGYTAESLVDAYYNGLALVRTESGDITPGEALLMYSAYSDVDYEKDYIPLDDKERATLAKLFGGNHGVSGNFRKIYTDLSRTAEMINCSSFDKLQEKYLAYAKDNGISLTKYNALPTNYSRDKIFISVFSDIGDAGNMADITDLFTSAVDKEANSSSGGSSGGSGGGGGGGKGSHQGGAAYIPVDAPVAEATFTDTSGHWAEKYILTLKESGVVNGNEDRSFRPDSTVSRAEFVKMICAMLGIAPADGSRFADVSSSEWFAGFVYGAYNAGIINGTGENAFSPYSPVTRQDAAVIINRACKLSGGAELTFGDSGNISDYAKEAVANLAAAKILGGYEDNTIRPLAHLTRAETAAILCRVQNID